MSSLKTYSFLIVTILLFSCSSPSAPLAQTPLPSKTPPQKAVIARFDPSSHFAWTYSVTVACASHDCPIHVELLKNETLISSVALKWPADNDTIEVADLDASYGFSDPLASDSDQTAWRIGSDEGGVGIAARTVQLTPHMRGLLVTQVVGFEHVKRIHSLFVADSGKMRRAWMADEGAGPTWSAAVLVPHLNGDRIIYFRGFQPDFGNEPDQLVAASYIWDEKKNALKPTTSVTLYGVIVGFYKTAPEARQVQLKAGECFYAFWVLPSQRFKVKGEGDFVLAALTTDRRLAEATAEKMGQCSETVITTIASAQ